MEPLGTLSEIFTWTYFGHAGGGLRIKRTALKLTNCRAEVMPGFSGVGGGVSVLGVCGFRG